MKTDLNEFYYKIPNEKPIHIARVWDRYSVNAGDRAHFSSLYTNIISTLLELQSGRL
jgi:hypothetical protein